jgi:Ca-activated chloride channel family protein
MEQLADHGDGNYAYIDNLNEARKTLVEQISATLETIAKDVKIQLEWNPSIISEYRLIGYENRLLNREDFNNDKVDAGEIGAGHTVTALYEITFAGAVQTRIEALRYQSGNEFTRSASNEIAYLKLRYKKPGETNSRLIQHALGNKDITTEIDKASDSLRFAASVAAFGELLRGGNNLQQFGYQDVLNLARSARGFDKHGYRGEYVRLVELAEALDTSS